MHGMRFGLLSIEWVLLLLQHIRRFMLLLYIHFFNKIKKGIINESLLVIKNDAVLWKLYVIELFSKRVMSLIRVEICTIP